MSNVPEGWKARFVGPKVDTKNKRSRLLNSRVQAATMEEISTSFTKLSINFPETYETLPGLPPVNNELTRFTILEEIDTDIVLNGKMFNSIYSINTKGSIPIGGYAYQSYNNWDIRTPEVENATVLATQQNRLSYKGEGNPWFIIGDSSNIKCSAAADGNIHLPQNIYAVDNFLTCDAGTGIAPSSGSDFFIVNKNKASIKTDNLDVQYLYGFYSEFDVDNNVNVTDSFRQMFLNTDIEAGYSGTINEYIGLSHTVSGLTVGGNTTEAHFIKNTSDMPITTAGGLTFSGGLPAHADDAAAGTAGLIAGQIYQTDGTAAAPLNAVGILMIKQ
tara:strand:- start:4762 stop:5754 length:993 start_codon:yes stop_codon:yes gene_type:complete